MLIKLLFVQTECSLWARKMKIDTTIIAEEEMLLVQKTVIDIAVEEDAAGSNE